MTPSPDCASEPVTGSRARGNVEVQCFALHNPALAPFADDIEPAREARFNSLADYLADPVTGVVGRSGTRCPRGLTVLNNVSFAV